MNQTEALIAGRREGKTLAELGQEQGISRERARQIIDKCMGTTALATGLISRHQFLKQVGISDKSTRAWALVSAQIQPVRVTSGGISLYRQNDVQAVKDLIAPLGLCPKCGGKKLIKARVCKSCWRKYRWTLYSPAEKQKYTAQIRQWGRTHVMERKRAQVRFWERKLKELQRTPSAKIENLQELVWALRALVRALEASQQGKGSPQKGGIMLGDGS